MQVVLHILLTISWSGDFDRSQSDKASFLKAPDVPPALFWIVAMVTAFRTISIIPDDGKLHKPTKGILSLYLYFLSLGVGAF